MALTQTDREAFAMIEGGFQGKWLKDSKALQRRNIPVGGAYPDGLIVLGHDTLNQPKTWVANVIFHESCHHQGGRVCSMEEEKRCILAQIEFDKTIGANHVDWLEKQTKIHAC